MSAKKVNICRAAAAAFVMLCHVNHLLEGLSTLVIDMKIEKKSNLMTTFWGMKCWPVRNDIKY